MLETPMRPSEIPLAAPRIVRHSPEEDHAWMQLYQCADDPAVALEVVHQLDLDPEAKRRCLALYLVCRVTVRHHHERLLRQDRLIRGLRTLGRVLVAAPAALVHALSARHATTTTTTPSTSRRSRKADTPPVLKDPLQAVVPAVDPAPASAARASDTGAVPLREVA
jgi:hypothetical protein